MAIDLETLDAALAALDDFARRNLPEAKLRELDRNDEFPEALVRRMCSDELGIQLFFVPEKYGGLGAGAYGVYRICEQLAGVDVGIATGVLATFLGSEPISVGGTEDQRRRWLGEIAERGILMAPDSPGINPP